MKAFFHPSQDLHIPKTYFTRGQMRQPQELPDRTGQMVEGLKALGIPVLQPADQGAAPISKVHDLGHLRFLESAHRRCTLTTRYSGMRRCERRGYDDYCHRFRRHP